MMCVLSIERLSWLSIVATAVNMLGWLAVQMKILAELCLCVLCIMISGVVVLLRCRTDCAR